MATRIELRNTGTGGCFRRLSSRRHADPAEHGDSGVETKPPGTQLHRRPLCSQRPHPLPSLPSGLGATGGGPVIASKKLGHGVIAY